MNDALKQIHSFYRQLLSLYISIDYNNAAFGKHAVSAIVSFYFYRLLDIKQR